MMGDSLGLPSLRGTGAGRTRLPLSSDRSLRVPLRSSRDAGPSARDRRLVFARAFGRCEGCGASVIGRPYTIAPRVGRGPGGPSRTAGGALWNLTLRCGSAAGPAGCHWRCEQRDEDLHDRGIWLQPGQNPRLVPVWLLTSDGTRVPVWLNDEGTYEFEPPPGGPGIGPARAAALSRIW